MPTIQKGEIVIISPASPLAMKVSAKARQPFPIDKVRKPLKNRLLSVQRLEACKGREHAQKPSIMEPEIMYRTETSISGGKLSKGHLGINRGKLVPEK